MFLLKNLSLTNINIFINFFKEFIKNQYLYKSHLIITFCRSRDSGTVRESKTYKFLKVIIYSIGKF